jgi:hypothetical protein
VGGKLEISRATVFKLATAGIAGLAILGSGGLFGHGLPNRFPVEAQKVAAYLDVERTHDQFRTDTCFLTDRDWPLEKFDERECMPRDGGKGTLLILGDSHAAHLWWGMNSVYRDNLNVMQATAAGCKPVLEQRPRQFPGCTRLMTYVLTKYVIEHPVDTLVLEARWESGDLPSLAQTLSWLHSKDVHVVLFGPMLQYDAPLPRLLAMAIRQHDPGAADRHRVRAMSEFDATMARMAKGEWDVPYVSMINLLCENDQCVEYTAPGVPLLSDYGHLTKEGSVLVAKRLRERGTF